MMTLSCAMGPVQLKKRSKAQMMHFMVGCFFLKGLNSDSLTLNGSAAEALGYVLICPFGHDLGGGFLYTWILTSFNS